MTFANVLDRLRKSSLLLYRLAAWSLVIAALSTATVVLSLRYWILPNVASFKDDIAGVVSRAAGQRIGIGDIAANWDGMRPQLVLRNVVVYDRQNRPALELGRVDSTLSWLSLAVMRVRFHALDIYSPVLDVRRDARGVLYVAGIEIDTAKQDGPGFADWLLHQHDVEVHRATVNWTDEVRGAPTLALSEVNIRLVNRGAHHRFGLQAIPPAHLAAPLDVRGDFVGNSLEALADWTGQLFLQVDYIDLGAWRAWVPLPIDLRSGAGALRSWVSLRRQELERIIADVRLADVRTQLRADLPELMLKEMTGRARWRRLPNGFELGTNRLRLATSTHTSMQPADMLLKLDYGAGGKAPQGELHATSLQLEPVVTLLDHLPVDEALRAHLQKLTPRGTLSDVNARWTGEWPAPARYAIRGGFTDLTLRQFERWPGFERVSGHVDASEKGGTLSLHGEKGMVEIPAIFRDALAFNTLSGQFAWTVQPDRLDLRFNNVAFANDDAAGTVSGSYRGGEPAQREIDLTGNFTRAEAAAVPRYMPVFLKNTQAWLQRALIAGRSNDVRFRVKGKLADFPYADSKRGTFEVNAHVMGGILDYADGWPRIENIDGDLRFRGRRMDITARDGSIFGARLSKVRAEIPVLGDERPVLTVTGEAEGPTADFLQFIAKSPVLDMLDRFTEQSRAQGRGRLALRLVLPLASLKDTRVTGAYQFINNQLVVEPAVPQIDQVNGRLEFSESGMRAPGLTGQFLGGPVTVSATTGRDSAVRVTMQGRVDADNLRRLGGPWWMQNLRGTAEWRGSLNVRRKNAELVVESNLQGIAANLPAPFQKSAAEITPFRYERRFGAQPERIAFTFGEVASGVMLKKGDVLERGHVRFGAGAATDPDHAGLAISGTAKLLDIDDWLRFSAQDGEGGLPITSADLRVVEADFFGRRFHDLSINAGAQGGAVNLTLAARELEGTASWRAQGKGRVAARFKRLHLPTPVPGSGAANPPGKPTDLPALDIVAETFQLGERSLGRLELNAIPEERDWRIEKLRVSNPDSTLVVDGVWQAAATQPRTQINLRLDVTDAGKTLVRWNLPEGLRRGTAKIEGTLNWAGAPQNFDYPTLGGNLIIDAANGQFLKMDPGIGKLLGILSLQSIPRRISLDFRDVFSDGFAFDSILGTVSINRGIASMDNFRLMGPAARVVMSGDIDLVRETQKLNVRVSPHISDGVSIAGALIGGPVAGVAAFLAQKILKDPLDQVAAFNYSVTGTWVDPFVAKVERPVFTEGKAP